jgi:tRNA nucleotidyltransferase (CCA-adding enzyme)
MEDPPCEQLLSRESDDLDISLSTLTGYHYALYLKAYLSSDAFRSSALATRSTLTSGDEMDTGKGQPGWSLGTISKIEANPEQSKNLETATAKVLGLSLDFVNLRKEEYDHASRIPAMVRVAAMRKVAHRR